MSGNKPTSELQPRFEDEFPHDGVQLDSDALLDYELGVSTISEVTASPLTPEVEVAVVPEPEAEPQPDLTSSRTTPSAPHKPRERSHGSTHRHLRRVGPDDNATGFRGPVDFNER